MLQDMQRRDEIVRNRLIRTLSSRRTRLLVMEVFVGKCIQRVMVRWSAVLLHSNADVVRV